jgi:molecular chaperone GrpE
MENGKPVETPPEQPSPPGEEAGGDLAALLAAAIEERDQLRDQVLRLRAEFENSRRRHEREKEQFGEFAGMESARRLLPILDDFERALKAAPEGDGPYAEFAKGMSLIYQRLFETLGKLGLEPLESVGQPFDPNLHHAVETVTGEDADHTVIDEFQRGYNFKGRLLRPAMVRVAVKS